MANLRIIHDNAADRATLTASSQAGALGPANLQVEGKGTVLRSTATSLTVTATLAVGEIVGGVVFPFCNLTSNAKIRVRGYTAPGDTTPLFDTGQVLACAYAPLGTFGWGGEPFAVNSFAYGGGAYGRVWFAPDTVRKLVIDLSDPDNAAGYIEASRLVFGNYWQPEKNANYGASATVVDTTTQSRSDSGDQQLDTGVVYRKLSMPLNEMTPQDRARVWHLFTHNGKRRPLLISLYPDDADPQLEQANQVYGRLSDLAAVASPYFRAHSTSLNIEEV